MVSSPRSPEHDATTEDVVGTWHARHAAVLRAYARERGVPAPDADEVVVETLVRAWRHADDFDPDRGSERAWLFGIARRVLADRHRTATRRGLRVVTDQPPDRPAEDPALARLVESAHVHDAIATLSDAHRTVLVEAYYEGRTTREIAERLQIPQGTVKSRLHHALRALRSELVRSGVLS